MTDIRRQRRLTVAAAAIALMLTAGCTATDNDSAPPTGGAPSVSPAPTNGTTPAGSQPFGAQCPNLPDTGDGSLVDLKNRDWVDALAQVPALSQLSVTTALAGLGSDFGGLQDATVFAPTDTAFRALGVTRGRELLTNPSAAADVLRYHVVPERLTPDNLAGEHRTLNGQTLEVSGSGEDFTVNGRAKISCGNLQTRNATIYLVDQVLQPS